MPVPNSKDHFEILTAVYEMDPNAIFAMDREGKLIFGNKAFHTLFSKLFGHEAVKNSDQSNILPLTLIERWKPYFDKAIAGEICKMDFNRYAENQKYNLQITLTPLIVHNQIIGVCYYTVDISPQRKIEAELLRSRSHLSNIMNAISDPIFVKDENHRMVFVNEAHCKLTGREEKDLIGKDDYDFHKKEEADIFWEKDEEVLRTGITNINEESNTDAGGTKHYVLTKKSIYINDTGEKFVVGIVTDITGRRIAEEKLLELNLKLEEKVQEELAKNREKDSLLMKQSRFASMGEMIGNIAHQWRQPLNALGLTIMNIQDAYEYNELTKETVADFVHRANHIIDHMSQTIDDFRNFFKPQKEKVQFPIDQIIKDAVSIIESFYESQSIGLWLDLSPNLKVLGYPSEFAQILLNLLSNSKDAILENKIDSPMVQIKAFEENGKTVVTVADNAGGISEDIIDKVFDPYFTTKEKGTGIGLYMSKMIVETSMGGSLSVRNLDGGAEFRIEL